MTLSQDLSLLEALPLPTAIVDKREHLVGLNQAARELLGDVEAGQHILTVLRQPAIIQAIGEALQQGHPTQARYVQRDHVHDTSFDVSCVPLRGSSVVLSFQDVTTLEAAGQMRRDFVANVSHELRSPLTTIQGFIETLQGPARGDVKAADRFLNTMSVEAERMIRLVADLLSLSTVESEERIRPTDRVDLVAVLHGVAHRLSQLAEHEAVQIDMSMTAPELWIYGNHDQLIQVFTNLCENAIKYGGDGGRIEMAAQPIARDPMLGCAAIQVDVRDFGQGFDDMHVARLTERFYRVDTHRSRAKGGTGLGLAIVKHIVNRHKGRLKIQSAVGEGSCFSVVFPVDL